MHNFSDICNEVQNMIPYESGRLQERYAQWLNAK